MKIVWAGLLATILTFSLTSSGSADDRPVIVTTFSILGDLTQRVGGDHVKVLTLVGPNEDAHVFEPGPRESAELARAALLIANGLGFEPWLERLTSAANFGGAATIASDGVTPLPVGEHEEDAGHDHEAFDPHAFQDLSNAALYVANIEKGLSAADPAHAADFKRNAAGLIAELQALDAALKAKFAAIAPEERRVLTSHDAFGYFGKAYGIEFVAVQGVSTDSEPSAEDLAKIVRQAREGHLSAIFMENMADPRLAETVAQESGVKIGGALYADALSDPSGPAPDYVSLIHHNAEQLLAAMR